MTLAPDPLEGGCLCGAVRYRASRPYDAANCHCSRCRRAVGAAFVSWVSFAAGDFAFTSGEPVRHAATADTTRTFCGRCGTSLTYHHAERSFEVVVTIASLDRPELVPPDRHEWASRALPSTQLDDGLPRYSGTPPRDQPKGA